MNIFTQQSKTHQPKHCCVHAFAFFLFLVVSCKGEGIHPGSSSAEHNGNHTDVCTLTVVDSIGVELGDSNYVFGAIREVDIGPDGSIYVLDWIKCAIFRYSSDCDFLQQIGGQGSGPGEMTQPGFFEVLDDGSICVVGQNGWQRYDSTGESMATQPEEGRNVRYMISADSTFIIGAKSEVEWLDDQMQITKRICRFDSQQPDSVVVQYHQIQYQIETTDMNEFMKAAVRVDLFPMLFSAGNGFVCLAPDPVEEPEILVFYEDGSVANTIMLPYQAVQKTDAEIADEKRFIEEFFHHSTGYTNSVDWTPLSYHPMIANLGVDSLSRIWVQRGFEQDPTFDLYDVSGEHLKTVVLPDRDDTAHWKFYISGNGILAVPEDPQSYYSVYIIELQE